MEKGLHRLREWWSREPHLREDDLAPPRRDVALARAMRAEAEAFALKDRRLNFSIESIGVIDAWLHEQQHLAVREVGAYIGDVIVRNGASAYWGRNGPMRRNAGIVVGNWLFDPFARVTGQIERSWKGAESLLEYVRRVLSCEGNPETAGEQIGLSPPRLIARTATDDLRDRWNRWRQRHP